MLIKVREIECAGKRQFFPLLESVTWA